jgi:hypothetical protein
MRFEDSVFINCPFDEQFYPLLRPLLYTVIYLGFAPRISLERSHSGEPRIDKILELIEASKYAIHDLSRIQAKSAGEFFRLNMPFELGIDVGCTTFGEDELTEKQCLILETEKYRFHQALSDLSNSDIAAHKDEPYEVVVAVRNWLARVSNQTAPGPSRIWLSFSEFMAANYEDLIDEGFSAKEIERLPVKELIDRMEVWVGITT